MFRMMLEMLGMVKPAPKPKEREVMVWVGDGMAPAGPELVGVLVNVHGWQGVCVEADLLTITVEWND